ncbi:hypothetical protein KKF84_13220, partial [Myxococcota bacterium]|nr:hypothetical protein [Myxococcota bacterium]MBU1536279.1 hypothetical protein [Myxococcota bacterium]
MEKRDAAKNLIRKLIHNNRDFIKESIKESLEAELLPAFNEVRTAFEEQIQGNLDTSLLLDEVVEEVLNEILEVPVDEGEIAAIEGELPQSGEEVPPVTDEEPRVVPPPPDELVMPDRSARAQFTWNAAKWPSHENYVETLMERARELGYEGEPVSMTDLETLTDIFSSLAVFYEKEIGDAGMAMESLITAFDYSDGSRAVLDAMEEFVTDEIRAMGMVAQVEELLGESDDPASMCSLLIFSGKLKLQHLGDMEGAREAFDKAAMIDPDNEEARSLLEAVTV